MSPPDLPPWLTPRASAAGQIAPHDGLDSELIATLTEHRSLWLTGPPASGLTSKAATLARAWAGTVIAARLTPCRTPADVILVIGEALGALPPGDEATVAAALHQAEGVLVVLDDADIPELSGVVDQLAALAPRSCWLLTGARAPKGAPFHALSPVDGGAPRGLPEGIAAPAKANLLAIMGGSLPGSMGLPAEMLLPCSGGREGLRRSAAAALRARTELEPARVAACALPDLEALLGLARGAPLRLGFCSDDALILRWMGDVLADPDAACTASAAAARLFHALGQPATAHSVLDAADRRNARARPASRALVAWGHGDLHAAQGELAAAEAAWRQAEDLLERARDPLLLAAMIRRQAGILSSRGESRRAAQRYRTARALHVRLDDPAGVSATIRGAADLALSAAEILSAEMLYDEAEATSAGIVESNNRRLGRASLALAQGDISRAKRLLSDPEFDAVALPLLDANRQRRLAELALRQGQHDEADRAARAAARAYAALGEGVAQGHTARLVGDIAAAAGCLTEAAAGWQRAIELQVRVRDVAGLRRTLRHAAALEEEAGSGAVAAELRDAIAALAAPDSLDTGTVHTGTASLLDRPTHTGITGAREATANPATRAMQSERDIDTQE